MLTRFVRIQLTIFTVASVIGVAVMVFAYIQVPTLFGLDKITVSLDLPATGGLYRFSNVTYRGVQIGKVTAVTLTPTGAKATLSLDTSPKIPADLQADVHSVSAVGEQYVDLRPRTDSPPYLQDGSVIAMRDTTIPQAVGPMLDKVSALVGSIPKDKLSELLGESFKGFNGAGDDFASLLDSSAKVTEDFNNTSDQTRALIEDSGPLLDGQAETADAIRLWARSLAGVTGQFADNDPQVRTLLETGPGLAQETSRLLDQIKPTLPLLLANLTSIGQIGVTYHPSLEELLVLLPPFISSLNTLGGANNPTGLPQGDFALTVSDPPACTVGFLPPSSWRSPSDETIIDTPNGLYCKLPQDSPISVRGARNDPCMGHPGKRAPTVQICDSDEPFEPLAQTQHTLGPYPFDPNLVGQGIPLDDRAGPDSNIYGPVQGTPLPPGLTPSGTPPDAPPPGALPASAPPVQAPPVQAGPPPADGAPATPPDAAPPTGPDSGNPPAAPSSFDGGGPGAGPSVAIARYDPRTGEYVAPDGQFYRQSDLAAHGANRTWKDMVLN
jgi:phospholipid/cholesterol/gamma-HCH transport system substrate-binding protein